MSESSTNSPTDTPSEPIIPVLPNARPVREVHWRRLRSITALLLREMASKYGKSPGGYAWAIVEPLGMIVVLSYGFSLVMRTPSLGNSFILFYATGYLPYNLFQKLSVSIASALIGTRSLLKYPAVWWLDAITARLILNLMTGILVAFILFNGIIALTGGQDFLNYGAVLRGFFMAALFGTGIGLMNSVLSGFYPVWSTAWAIATRPLLLASAVLYLFEELPPLGKTILWYNPLVHINGTVRSGFFPTYRPEYVSPIYVMSVSVILVTFGLLFLRRYHREILNR